MIESGERVECVACDEGMGVQDIQDLENLLDIRSCQKKDHEKIIKSKTTTTTN